MAVVGGGNTAVEEALYLANIWFSYSSTSARLFASRTDYAGSLVEKR